MPTEPQDPRTRFPKPPFPEQKQPAPGEEDQLNPKPDSGQTSYKGSGKLEGVVINTCSIESFTPAEQLPAYAATKAALASLTSSFAKMAMKQGVRVNGVAPGPVWTPFIPSTMPAEKVAKFGSNTIFERPAQPVEQAAIYVFLASDDASYVSGEIYGATGGRMPI